MHNASAAIVESTPAHLVPWRNPDGDFTATYVNTHTGRFSGTLTIDQIGTLAEGRLSEIPDGWFVLISGTVECVRLFGDDDSPTATVRLSSGTGADVIVHFTDRHYANVWGYLVMGRRFGLAGFVRRTSADVPPFVTFTQLLMMRTDVLTPEAYDVHRQAVTL